VGRAGDTRLALELHRAARRVSKLLVLSSVGGDKVLPWMVSTAGNVKCFDTVSLSQKLSLHCHALHPITLHFLCLRDADVKKAAPPPPVLLLPSPHDVAADDLDGSAGACQQGLEGLVV